MNKILFRSLFFLNKIVYCFFLVLLNYHFYILGCHTGHVTFYVAEHFQPAQIVGVDIDQQLIQQARHQLWNRIQTANNNNNTNTTTTNNNINQNKRYPFNLRFQQV